MNVGSLILIPETVLTYKSELLLAWRRGDRSLLPDFVSVPEAVENQPDYHFGEAYTLRHYHDTAGWKGLWFYTLGRQANTDAFRPGNNLVEQMIPRGDLERLRMMRARDPLTRNGGGEPDLFLYDDRGSFMFVEVKKRPDRLRPSQHRSIAQLLAVKRGRARSSRAVMR